MSHKLLGELTERHVGRSFLIFPGSRRIIRIGDVIGPVQKIDIGKRVYDVNGVIQVENQEQLARRAKKG